MLAGETVPVFLVVSTRYVSQFCLYLGIDVAAEPDLITEVDDYLKRPLPEGSGDLADAGGEIGLGDLSMILAN